MLPGIKSHATCIRFSPYLYKLFEKADDDQIPAMLNLPYRMVFAVSTSDNILLYHTQSIMPIAILKSIHYDSINDMAWMGTSMLMAASSDGYCSFVQLDAKIAGQKLEVESEQMPEDLKDHYESYYKVNFKSNEDAANQVKEQGFAKITFKSKKNIVLQSVPDQLVSSSAPKVEQP